MLIIVNMKKKTFLAGKTFDLTARQKQLWDINGEIPQKIEFPEIISKNDFEYYLILDDGDKILDSSFSYDYLYNLLTGQEVVRSSNKGNIMTKLSALMKTVVDGVLRNGQKLGYLDSSLKFTEEGTESLLAIFFKGNKEVVGKEWEKELADRKRCKKSKDCNESED